MVKDFLNVTPDSGTAGSKEVLATAAPNVNMQPRSTTLSVSASGDLTRAIIANQLGLFLFGVRYKPSSSAPWLFLGGNGTIGIDSTGLLKMSINIDLTITATNFIPCVLMSPETYTLLSSAGYTIFKTSSSTGSRIQMSSITLDDFPRLQVLSSDGSSKGVDILFELQDPNKNLTPIMQIGVGKTYIID